MRKISIAIILVVGLVSNAYAFISLGLRGGYAYESLIAKEIHEITKYITGNTTTIKDTTYTPTGKEAETKHPKGLGGELLCEISPPVIPIGVELGVGSYTTSFKELEIDTIVWFVDTIIDTTKWRYTISSTKLCGFVEYFIPGIPMVSPWVGIGPFLGLNALKSKNEELNITYEGERMTNYGIFAGAGAKIGMVPKLSLNAGLLFHYFIISKGKYTQERKIGNTTWETTWEKKFSQWNINFFVGIVYSIM